MAESVAIKVYIYIYTYIYIYIYITNKARSVAGRLSGSHLNRQRLGKRRRRADAQCGLCGKRARAGLGSDLYTDEKIV